MAVDILILAPINSLSCRFVFECLSGVRQQGISGAVLADGMGLGKTFQTIASLYCLLTKGIFGHPTCKKPLILCPTSLVQVSAELGWVADHSASCALVSHSIRCFPGARQCLGLCFCNPELLGASCQVLDVNGLQHATCPTPALRM